MTGIGGHSNHRNEAVRWWAPLPAGWTSFCRNRHGCAARSTARNLARDRYCWEVEVERLLHAFRQSAPSVRRRLLWHHRPNGATRVETRGCALGARASRATLYVPAGVVDTVSSRVSPVLAVNQLGRSKWRWCHSTSSPQRMV